MAEHHSSSQFSDLTIMPHPQAGVGTLDPETGRVTEDMLIHTRLPASHPLAIKIRADYEANAARLTRASPFVWVLGGLYQLQNPGESMDMVPVRIELTHLNVKTKRIFDFMEKMVRTKKASKEHMSRFLAVIDVPAMLVCAAVVIPELKLGKNIEFDANNHLITRLLEHTFDRRPIKPLGPNGELPREATEEKEVKTGGQTSKASVHQEASTSKSSDVAGATKTETKSATTGLDGSHESKPKMPGFSFSHAAIHGVAPVDDKQSDKGKGKENVQEPAKETKNYGRLTQIEDLEHEVPEPMSVSDLTSALKDLCSQASAGGQNEIPEAEISAAHLARPVPAGLSFDEEDQKGLDAELDRLRHGTHAADTKHGKAAVKKGPGFAGPPATSEEDYRSKVKEASVRQMKIEAGGVFARLAEKSFERNEQLIKEEEAKATRE